MTIQRIPVSRSQFDNPQDMFEAGIREHRDRRLAHQQRQQQQQDNESLPKYYSQVPSYDCSGLMYTGMIQMGTPGQSFNVKLDTSTSVSWLISVDCDQTCHFNHINHYNPYTSTTHTGINASLSSNYKEQKHNDWQSISGTFIQDTVNLGNNVSVSDYVFLEVTNYDYIPKCDGEGGRLGLGLSSSPPVESIWDRMTLKNPIFSMYLNPGEDYLYKGEFPDSNHGSEMIVGGVDSEHYTGCLQWHPPSNIPGTESQWNVGLRAVSVSQSDNDGSSSSTNIDVNGYVRFDTGKSGIIGHPDAIGQLTSVLGLECWILGLDDEGLFPQKCDDPNGFDLADIGCDRTLSPIDFILEDGTTYQLTHDDLVKEVNMEYCGIVCVAMIKSDIDFARNTFEFGIEFFHHYYVAFNVETKSIGWAEAVSQASDPTTKKRCDADYTYDIAYYTEALNVVPGGDDTTMITDPMDAPAISPTSINDTTTAMNNAMDATAPAISTLSNNIKTWSSKNPDMIVAATAGSFVSILIFVWTILTCRHMFRHRAYARADVDDETAVTGKPNLADETELPDLI